jgi:hypothetical protein
MKLSDPGDKEVEQRFPGFSGYHYIINYRQRSEYTTALLPTKIAAHEL